MGIYWLVPESIRWLISNGRTEEAKKIIERAAKENKKAVPYHLFRNADLSEIDLDKDSRDSKQPRHIEQKVTVLDLFRPRIIFVRTINMCFQVIGKQFRSSKVEYNFNILVV